MVRRAMAGWPIYNVGAKVMEVMRTVTTFPSFSAGHHAVPEIVPSGAQFR